MKFLCFCLLFCLSQPTFAAYFYLSPDSLYPSGYLADTQLSKRWVKSKTQNWLQVEKEGKVFWSPAYNFILRDEIDRTTAILQHGTFMFAAANESSKRVRYVERLEKVNVLARSGSYWKVESHGKTGYIWRSNLIALEDFKTPGAHAYCTELNCPAMNTPVAQKQSRWTTAGRTYFSLKQNISIDWQASQVPEHGLVWWVSEKQASAWTSPKNSNQKVASQNLFSKGLFDMVKHPYLPNVYFASAKGLYFSLDGKKWKRRDDFPAENIPLAYADNGLLFAGQWVSHDQGQSFQKYIRWDKILKLLHQQKVSDLNIRDIKILDNDGRKILLELGKNQGQDLFLVTSDQGRNWKKF